MKNVIAKTFLFVCALVAVFEGIVFLAVRFGFVPLNTAARFYSSLLQTPERLDLTLWTAIGFLIAGIIFFYHVTRRTSRQKSITIEDKHGVVRIPLEAIEKFISQVLSASNRHSSLSDLEAAIDMRGKWIYINIRANITSAVPLRQEVYKIRKALKEEIERVFEFSNFKISFHIGEISGNTETKDIKLTDKEAGFGVFDGDMEDIAKEDAPEDAVVKRAPWDIFAKRSRNQRGAPQNYAYTDKLSMGKSV